MLIGARKIPTTRIFQQASYLMTNRCVADSILPLNENTRELTTDADISGNMGARKMASLDDVSEASLATKFPFMTTTGIRRFSKDHFVQNNLDIEDIIKWCQLNAAKHGTSAPQFTAMSALLNEVADAFALQDSIAEKMANTSNLRTATIDFLSSPTKAAPLDTSEILKQLNPPAGVATTTFKREMSTITSSPPRLAKAESFIALETSSTETNPKPVIQNAPPVIPKQVLSIVKEPHMLLSEEQRLVADLVLKGHNIFYTGPAGTGKSFLLKHIVKVLHDKYDEGVGVTASTGLAAYNIGGMTINSYLGIGIGLGTPQDILRRIKNNKKIKQRWLDLNVLIIDEVSMINGVLIDKLDFVARKLRNPSKPFGGIQIVLCGDFYQLPPVDGKKDFQKEEVIYAFESNFWKSHVKLQIILTKIFRQQTDKEFLKMLKMVRDGEVDDSTVRKFKSLSRPLDVSDGVLPTRLFPTRRETEVVNREMMQNLPGESFTFEAFDSGSMINSDQGRKMLENFLAPAKIELKVGSQVMLIKNIDDKLVNGTLGIVVGFMDDSTFSQVQGINIEFFNGLNKDNTYYDYDSDTEQSNRYPSVNRLYKKISDPLNSSIFDCLAKVKQNIMENMDSDNQQPQPIAEAEPTVLYDTTDDTAYAPSENTEIVDSQPVDIRRLRRNEKEGILQDIERKEALLKSLRENASLTRYPLVSFKVGDKERRMVLIQREEFVVEDEKRVPVISRKQIPIMLSWALSIHKSQGQTLHKVTVDLKRIFENGQAYVALSRAVHRRGLQVLNFDKGKIKTNSKVKEFYDNLFTAMEAVRMIDDGSFNPDTSAHLRPQRQLHELENLISNTASPERFRKPQYTSMKTPQPTKRKAQSINEMLSRKRPSPKTEVVNNQGDAPISFINLSDDDF